MIAPFVSERERIMALETSEWLEIKLWILNGMSLGERII